MLRQRSRVKKVFLLIHNNSFLLENSYEMEEPFLTATFNTNDKKSVLHYVLRRRGGLKKECRRATQIKHTKEKAEMVILKVFHVNKDDLAKVIEDVVKSFICIRLLVYDLMWGRGRQILLFISRHLRISVC